MLCSVLVPGIAPTYHPARFEVDPTPGVGGGTLNLRLRRWRGDL
jgi:hypothetical protein